MVFRTEYEARPDQGMRLTHADKALMLGSCFTDSIGEELDIDGFDVQHNPMGPLYNPASIRRAAALAMGLEQPTYRQDAEGAWHCLDFASRYASPDLDGLRARVEDGLQALRRRIEQSNVFIFTLGTAYVFSLAGEGPTVGNCHKFPPQAFTRRRLSTEQAQAELRGLVSLLPAGARAIFTVSPIRHVADGLHGNQLSKAVLHLAVDGILGDSPALHYFPAYELLIDDLRDYRYYAADMKHPSDVAVAYVYEKFKQTCFSPETAEAAMRSRKERMRSRHRPLNP